MKKDGWSIGIENFRTLEMATWSGDGVCLLVGPNGSGKSSLLTAMEMLRSFSIRGIPSAIKYFGGGASQLRNEAETRTLAFELGLEGVHWRVELPEVNGMVGSAVAEQVHVDGDLVLVRRPFESTFSYKGVDRAIFGDDVCIRQAMIHEEEPEIVAFLDNLRRMRVYHTYDLKAMVRPLPEDKGNAYLHPTGKNFLQVMQTWRSSPRQYDRQSEWVLEKARDAFPKLIEDIDVAPEGRLYPPGAGVNDGIPIDFAADGLKTGLLHLSAVAGAPEGSLVALDEFENFLHPYAIRSLLESIREIADERSLTVLMASHSPVVLNEFGHQPELVFVLEPGVKGPVPLTELHHQEWLAHFALGDLFDRFEFGAPPIAQAAKG